MDHTEGGLPGTQSTHAANFAAGLVTSLREPVLLINSELVAITANSQFYTTFKMGRVIVVGKNISTFEYDGWDSPQLLEQINKSFSQQKNFSDLNIQFSSPGGKEAVYSLNGAYIPDNGEEYVMLSFKLIEKENKKYNTPDFKNIESILAHAPAMICILRGPKFVFELANENYYQLVGNREIIGKPAIEAIPEAKGQGFFELLEEVKRTGKPFKGFEVPIKLN